MDNNIQQIEATPRFSTPNTVLNAGAVEVESKRAVAEALAQVRLAQMVGRDLNAVYAEVMEACSVPAMAEVAFYELPQGGEKITGPSIKLIEQIASAMGHFEWGHRELSRTESTSDSFGRSEVEVFVWDKLKNNRSLRQITVMHVRDSRNGAQALKYQRDIDNAIANIAAKQMRGRLQALLPKWLVEAAIQRCRDTLAGNSPASISERVRKMITRFSTYGISPEMIGAYLNIKSLENITLDHLTSLMGVYQAIKDGAPIGDYFHAAAPEEEVGSIKDVINALPPAPTEQKAPPPMPTATPEPVPVPTAKPEPQAAPEPAPEPANAKQERRNTTRQQAPAPQLEPQPEPKPEAAPTDSEDGILF